MPGLFPKGSWDLANKYLGRAWSGAILVGGSVVLVSLGVKHFKGDSSSEEKEKKDAKGD